MRRQLVDLLIAGLAGLAAAAAAAALGGRLVRLPDGGVVNARVTDAEIAELLGGR